MTYTYNISNANPALLQDECVAAGLPVSYIQGGALGSDEVTVVTFRVLTQPEQTTLGDVVAAHDGRPRKARPLYAIRADVQALSVGQFNNVWNDLSAAAAPAPRKYLLDAGPNAAAIFCFDWCVYTSGGTAAQIKAAQLSLTAEYVQDNVKYLVHPPFDTSINIPGDEVA